MNQPPFLPSSASSLLAHAGCALWKGLSSFGSSLGTRLPAWLFLLLTSWLIMGCDLLAKGSSTSSSFSSSAFADFGQLSSMSRLLFWSSYDCHIDAAAQLIGPLDDVLRGGAAADVPEAELVVVVVEEGGLWPGEAVAMNALGPSENHSSPWWQGEASTQTQSRSSSSSSTEPQDSAKENDTESNRWSWIRNSTLAAAAHVGRRMNMSLSADTSSPEDSSRMLGFRLTRRKRYHHHHHRHVYPTTRHSSPIRAKERPVSSSAPTPSPTPVTSKTSDKKKQQKYPKYLNARYIFSLFQKNDGSEGDADGIPTRYLRMHKNNRKMAQQSLQSTLQWRQEHDIDTLLARPHPYYDVCKAVFPHVFLGRDKRNQVVFVQRPALLDLELARANHLSKEQLLLHYVYVNEYLWQVMEGSHPLGTMTSIIDLTGLQLSVLRKRDILSFVKVFVSTMDAHYPQRAHKTLLLNTPRWFHTLYKLFSPLLRETTKSKIDMYARGKKQDEALLKYFGAEEAKKLLPASFWSHHHQHEGKDKKSKDCSGNQKRSRHDERTGEDDELSENINENPEDNEEEDENDLEKVAHEFTSWDSVLERQLREFVLARLKEAGATMQPVIPKSTKKKKRKRT